jgi:cytochrome P450
VATEVVTDEAYARYCAGQLADPYPLFDRLRAAEPVHWSERLDAWLVTRYDDVLHGLTDPRLANDRAAAYMRALPVAMQSRYALLGEHIGNWLGFTDPPKHTRMRRLLSQAFTPRLAEGMRGRIQGVVDALLDRIGRQPRLDLVQDFAYVLPTWVIYEVLGLPRDRQEEFRALSQRIVPFSGNVGPALVDIAPAAHVATVQLQEFFLGIAAERRREPKEDLVTQLARALAMGELSEPEFVGLCEFTFVAGHETTVSLIASGLMLLLTHPESLAQLLGDWSLMPSAVEEFLRFEAPVQISPRVARERLTIRGQVIAEGQTVILVNAAANRDPEQFPHPARLDIAREDNRHVSFGWAQHFCLGAPLARLEGRIAIESLFRRLPAVRVESTRHEWVPNMSLRQLASLPAWLG